MKRISNNNFYLMLAFLFMIFNGSAFASQQKITCVMGMVDAKNILNEENNSGDDMISHAISFAAEGESEFKMKSTSGVNEVTVNISAYKDEFLDLTSLNFSVVTAEQKRIVMGSALLKYDGKSKGGGWEFGPAGTDRLVVIEGSTQPVASQAHVNADLGILLRKYGLKSLKYSHNFYAIHEVLQEAVKAGEKIPDDTMVYFLFNFMNCYRQ